MENVQRLISRRSSKFICRKIIRKRSTRFQPGDALSSPNISKTQIRSRADLISFPTEPPPCMICDRPTVHQITRSSNREGNAGRPYYICLPCGKFHCFADRKGNDPRNPHCHCGTYSKRQLSDVEWSPRRKIHYVCRLGRCNYYRHKFGDYYRYKVEDSS